MAETSCSQLLLTEFVELYMLKINLLVVCTIMFKDCGCSCSCCTCAFTFCVVQVREAGMSVSEKDNDGATPLHFASARGGCIRHTLC